MDESTDTHMFTGFCALIILSHAKQSKTGTHWNTITLTLTKLPALTHPHPHPHPHMHPPPTHTHTHIGRSRTLGLQVWMVCRVLPQRLYVARWHASVTALYRVQHKDCMLPGCSTKTACCQLIHISDCFVQGAAQRLYVANWSTSVTDFCRVRPL